MGETIVFQSLYAPTRMHQEQTCQLNQSDNVAPDLDLSLGLTSVGYISTHYDPWTIKKNLTPSDLGDLSWLLLPKRVVETQLLPLMSERMVESVHDSQGATVTVYDNDMKTKHELVFKYWGKSSKSYVLQTNWKREFVNVRKLKEGDLVGLYWDVRCSAFVFSLLQRGSLDYWIIG